jgi:hypothetical protein
MHACVCRAAIVRELEALMLVVEQWPQRRDTCLAQATAAVGAAVDTPPAVAASGGSRRASGTHNAAASGTSPRGAVGLDTSHAAATLAWLADHNNMEARVIEQLVSLKPHVTASTGGGTLSGQWDAQLVRSSASGWLVKSTQRRHNT